MLKYAAKEFCLNTGLHGYKFLFLPKRILLERIIWLALVISSVITAVIISWLAWQSTHKYFVQTVTDSTHHPIWNYPFPAVTVCGFNQISKSKLYKIVKSMKFPVGSSFELFQSDLKYLIHLLPVLPADKDIPFLNLTRLQDLFDYNHIAAHELLQIVSPSCTDILRRCKWKGEEKRCETLFEQTKITLGFCCSFNYYAIKNHTFSGALPSKTPKKPRRVSGCGYKTGLEVVLDNHLDDYYATDHASYGHRLLIHYPYDFPGWGTPVMLNGLKDNTFISVSPIKTKCSANVARLTIEERNCLFDIEKELNNFRYYTYDNCLAECRSNITMKLCGCIPFYLYNEHVSGSFKSSRICNLRDSSCLSKYKRVIMSSKPGYEMQEKLDACWCLQNCEYADYHIECSAGEFSRKYAVNENDLYNGIKIGNQSVFRIFFNDLVATKNTRILRYYWHTLFGKSGLV